MFYLAFYRIYSGEVGVCRRDFTHGLVQLVKVGTRLLRAGLSLTELTRRHKLHSLRYLSGRADGTDTALYGFHITTGYNITPKKYFTSSDVVVRGDIFNFLFDVQPSHRHRCNDRDSSRYYAEYKGSLFHKETPFDNPLVGLPAGVNPCR